ncbi:hypothetical protein [Streptomyces sp. NPDC091416]
MAGQLLGGVRGGAPADIAEGGVAPWAGVV